MKKNKILLGLGAITTALAPLAATISCGSAKQITQTNSTISNAFQAAAATAAPATNLDEFNGGTQNLIKEKYSTNLRFIEESIKPKKTKEWSPNYRMKNYDNILPKQWYQNALRDGWQSIDSYQLYQQFVYEKGKLATKSSATFGAFPTPGNSSWLGVYYNPGGDLNGGRGPYDFVGSWSANRSELSPIWKGAEKESWNNIDDSLTWYHYEGGDTQMFLWDQNNMENAIKRLEYMKRLKRVDLNAVMDETGEDANGNVVSRNYVMLDGELVPVDDLPVGVYNLYYVRHTGLEDDQDDLVRDDNGWPVVVTDRDKDKMLNGIINPTCTASTTTYPDISSVTINRPSTVTTPLYSGVDREAATVIDYPADYVVNKPYDIDHQRASTTNLDNRYYTGRYRIAQKADSFDHLMDKKLVHMPFKDSRSDLERLTVGGEQKSSEVPNRFGRLGKYGDVYTENQLHHYAWAWVEDGQGGYKIWKSAARLRYFLDKWGDGTDPATKNHVDSLPATTHLPMTSIQPSSGHGHYKFWGSFQRIFPVKEWFVGSEFEVSDRGF